MRDDTRVGPYRLAERIGTGPIAQTFRGELADGRDAPPLVCIKRITVAAGPELEAVLNEAGVIASLEHPEIAQLHYFGRTDDGCYLAYELVDGIDLRTLLRIHGALGKSMTVYIATRVAMALAACHQHGLVHRDVAPANILLTPRGEVKLADLGVAKARGHNSPTRVDMAAGKPPYMAPEYAVGKHVGPLTDLYSLGVVLYECLTGDRPYEGISAAQTSELAARGQRPQLQARAPRTPVQLVGLVDALLSPAPAARPADAGRVLQRLRAAEVQTDMADALRDLVIDIGARPPVALRAAPAPPSAAPSKSPEKRSPRSARRTPQVMSNAQPARQGPGAKMAWLATAAMLAALGWLCMRVLG